MTVEEEAHARFFLRMQVYWGKHFSMKLFDEFKVISSTVEPVFAKMCQQVAENLLKSFLLSSGENFANEWNPKTDQEKGIYDKWCKLYTPHIHEQFVALPEGDMKLGMFVVATLISHKELSSFFKNDACASPEYLEERCGEKNSNYTSRKIKNVQ